MILLVYDISQSSYDKQLRVTKLYSLHFRFNWAECSLVSVSEIVELFRIDLIPFCLFTLRSPLQDYIVQLEIIFLFRASLTIYWDLLR